LKNYFFAFSNRNFFKTQFSDGLFSVIWFKIVLFVNEIAISNAPLVDCCYMIDIQPG